MDKTIEEIFSSADNIIKNVNQFQERHVIDTGKTVASKDMICDLNAIVMEGFRLREKIVETKFYEGKENITIDVISLEKYINTLQMTEKNAKNLDVRSAMDAWNASKLIIAKMACDVLDYRDSLN